MENNSIDKKSYLSRQRLLEHSSSPLNFGKFDPADFSSGQHNPSCGDSVALTGIVRAGRLEDIRFEGKGCILSVAMASMLTEHVKGMSLEDVLKLNEEIVEQLLGLTLGPNRLQCGMLSVTALQTGIKDYKKS